MDETETIKEPIGMLQQRKIEAMIIKPIYELIKREFGIDKAKAIIEEAIINDAINTGKAFAAKEAEQTTLESFARLQPLWRKDDALESELITSNHQHYEYNITRCRYAELYQSLELSEIGFLLSCNRDRKFIEGYAPHIQLTRTQTIMEGAKFCDFRYCVKKQLSTKGDTL